MEEQEAFYVHLQVLQGSLTENEAFKSKAILEEVVKHLAVKFPVYLRVEPEIVENEERFVGSERATWSLRSRISVGSTENLEPGFY